LFNNCLSPQAKKKNAFTVASRKKTTHITLKVHALCD